MRGNVVCVTIYVSSGRTMARPIFDRVIFREKVRLRDIIPFFIILAVGGVLSIYSAYNDFGIGITLASIAIVLESSNGLSCGIYLNKWESNDCQQERESYDLFCYDYSS